MKKLFGFIILTVLLSSCYKDYIKDFDYNSVYFPYQTDVRTLVVGEGMQIEIGVALGGVRENTLDRNVGFKLDNSLITPAILTTMKGGASYIKTAVQSVTTLAPLPANYFTLSDNSNFVIKKGQHMGAITLKVDSARFLADAATLNPNYVLPFYITTAKADSILPDKRYAVIGLQYENMLFGNYWHGGVTTVTSPTGTVIKTIPYYTTIPSPENRVWKLTTIAPNALTINGYSDQTTSKGEMKVTFDGTNISVSSVAGSTFTILPNAASSYNKAKLLQNRKIVLSYKYIGTDGNTYSAQDTLTFRNRIRDGVNEWQDENPTHYQ